MFEHIGRDLDPRWGLRWLFAGGLLGVSSAVSWGAVLVVEGAVFAVLDTWSAWFAPRVLPPPPPPPQEQETMRLIEVLLGDPELTADMLPPPPLEPPPPPPRVVSPEPPEPSEAAAKAPESAPDPDAPAPLAPVDPEPALADAADPPPDGDLADPPAEGAPELAPRPDRDTLEDWRQRGLLALRRPKFQRPDGQDVDMEGWDGIFGPRDLPLLAEAVAEQERRRLAALGKPGGGYRLDHASMGGGLMGAMHVMRLPPSRDLADAAPAWFPDEARAVVTEPVACTVYAWVDGFGSPVEVDVVKCPEPLAEAALEAAWSSRWMLAPDLAERARVKLEVAFDPAAKPSREVRKRWKAWPARKAEIEAEIAAKAAAQTGP